MMHTGYMLAHMGDEVAAGDWGEMAEVMREMMGPYRVGGGWWFWQFHWILELVTWVLIIAFLAAAVRWMWKKAGK